MSLTAVLLTGACAEGTKVDSELLSSEGGSRGSGQGGMIGKASGGASVIVRGGGSGIGGTGNRAQNGGTLNADTSSPGGSTTSAAGAAPAAFGGFGGTTSAVAATGGASPSTVPAPIQGLGIQIEKQSLEGVIIKSNLVLVNVGSQMVDLTTVRIRYYFTRDSSDTSSVLETYFAGPDIAKENIKIASFEMGLSSEERYFELSFVAATVNGAVVSPIVRGNGRLSIQIGLHAQDWSAPNATNDYSYTGSVVGYSERITVYTGGTLVWGVEPVAILTGAGGGAGAAGASSFERAGASSTGGNGGTGGIGTEDAGGHTSGASAGAPLAGAAGALSGAGSAGTP